MATLRQLVDSLDAYLETSPALGISVIKGYPDFRRPDLTPPVAALFYSGSSTSPGEQVRGRVGGNSHTVALVLGIYAADEINLMELAERLQAIRKAKPLLTAGSGLGVQQVRLYLGDDERAAPDGEDPKELRHFITVPVVLAMVQQYE